MKGTTYRQDRPFTDKVHEGIAVPQVYPLLGLKLVERDAEAAQIKDSDYSIDYEDEDKDGTRVYIQERSRQKTYATYNDFTLRYKRPEHSEECEQFSEFFKMKGKSRRFTGPFYMLYGIIDQEGLTYEKFVVVDLRMLFKAIKDGLIVVDETIDTGRTSKVVDGVMYACVKWNPDHSSTFAAFGIEHLHQVLPECILLQKGFLPGGVEIAPLSEEDKARTRAIFADCKDTGSAPSDGQMKFLDDFEKKNSLCVSNREMLSSKAAHDLIDFLKSDG